MSKGVSHLFHGTRGERVANAIKPSVQRKAVTDWADAKAAELCSVSNRKRDQFKTACVAVDELTGEMYFGRNGGIDRQGTGIHPALLSILPDSSLNAYPTPWNCAESDAINRALHSGAQLNNIHIYTISTARRGKGDNAYGHDKASCANCTHAFKGRVRRNNTGWTD